MYVKLIVILDIMAPNVKNVLLVVMGLIVHLPAIFVLKRSVIQPQVYAK